MKSRLIVTNFVVILLVLWLPIPITPKLLLMLAATLGALVALVRYTARFVADPRIAVFDPAEHDVSLNQLDRIAIASAQLESAGFRRLGELVVDSPPRRGGIAARLLVAVFENDAGSRAVATAIRSQADDAVFEGGSVEISTRFTDVVRSTTNLPPSRAMFDPMPGQVTERFPQLPDGAKLARVHEALLGRGGHGTPAPTAIGDLADRMRVLLREHRERLRAAGYFRLDAAGKIYVPTIRGVLHLAGRRLWPMRAIIDARARARAAARLAELGLDSLAR